MLATLIAAVVSGEVSEATARVRRSATAYALAGLLGLCGVGFLVGAGFVALARELGTITASLWVGGGFVVAALLVFLIHRISARVRARRVARRRSTEAKALASTAALALVPTLLAAGRGHAVGLLASAAVAALGYGIYRENRTRRDPLGDEDEI